MLGYVRVNEFLALQLRVVELETVVKELVQDALKTIEVELHRRKSLQT